MALLDSNVLKLAPDAGAPAYRSAPHNIEAEQSLLGAILVNNDAFYRVSDFLEPKHFFEPIHQTIYETAGSLIRMGKVATPVTLKTFLPAETDIGGMTVGQYLARLAAEATTIINAQDYGRTIYELALRRDLIRIGEDMVNVAFDAPVDFAPRAQIEDAERRLYELAESGRYDGGFQRFAPGAHGRRRHGGQSLPARRQIVGHCHRPARSRHQDGRPAALRPDHRRRASRHGQDRARHQHRLQRREGASRRSSGRRHDEVRQWRHRRLLLLRNVGRTARHPYHRRAHRHSPRARSAAAASREADFEKIRDYSIELQSLPLYVDETGGLSISQLTARARRLKRQKGLDLIVVDYIQLLQGSGKRGNDNRVQEVTEITTSLKALAKELNVPIIALSQLSRQVESRDDKRPQLSDLRESGSIEQDADVVMFVFREEYYLANKEPRAGTPEYEKWQLDMSLVHGKAEVIIGKQRHGPTGTVELQFEASLTRFGDLTHDSHLPERTY